MAFSRRLEQENLAQGARLFRTAARTETVLALPHMQATNGVRSTPEDLQEAVAGEHFESREIYPRYIAVAIDEGAKRAMLAFDNVMEVEKVHHELCTEALERVESGEDLPPENIYICSICGNTVMGQPPEECPVCGTPEEEFKEVH